MTPDRSDTRGAVQLVDILMAAILFIAIITTAPIWWRFIEMVSKDADPFSALLLQLFLPMLIVAAMVSVAISARRKVIR